MCRFLIALFLSLAPMIVWSQDITLDGPAGALGATLVRPVGDSLGGALILPGSGPTDRDGNNPFGVAARPYDLLAESLAARGISSLRADKRGIGASGGDGNAVSLDLYAEDARVLVSHLRAETGHPCIWLIGHSEGGLVAMRYAARFADVCGLVLLAVPGRPLREIVREQLGAASVPQEALEDVLDVMDKLVAGERVDVADRSPVSQSLFPPQVQGFWMDLLARDPAQMLAVLDMPVLVVQGGADVQVKPADARRLAEAGQQVELLELPDMTHVLKSASGTDRAASLLTYGDPDLPLAGGLAAAIVRFVTMVRE